MVASVFDSLGWKPFHPPSGSALVSTPVLCGYCPRSTLARAGQHSAVGT